MKCLKCNNFNSVGMNMKCRYFICNCGQEYVWSDVCDNPENMIIFDPITKYIYTQEEAEQQCKEVKNRLLNHCTKQGYWVMK